MSICQGCGLEFERPSNRGREPKWCSGRCRKRALYSRPCPECGVLMGGSNGRGVNAPRICVICQRGRNAERNARILEGWLRGEQAPVIADREGVAASAVMAVVDRHRRVKGEPVPVHRRSNRACWGLIRQRWAEGVSAPEIAAECDTTAANITFMIATMRRSGIDVPRRVATADEILARRDRIAVLWRDGLSGPEIAVSLGMSPAALFTEVSRMRQVGYDMPHRYKPRKRNATTKFPEQVAA